MFSLDWKVNIYYVHKTDWLTGLQLDLTQRGNPYWSLGVQTYLLIRDTSLLGVGLISHLALF